MKKLRIRSGDIHLIVVLLNTPTANAIWNALPFQSEARTWGEEVYFSAPVETDLESDARALVTAGEMAFWVEGSCIAIGYGPTPISEGNEIRLAANTNIWGTTADDVRCLSNVEEGDVVEVEKIAQDN